MVVSLSVVFPFYPTFSKVTGDNRTAICYSVFVHSIFSFCIPHKKNNHRPYLLRYQFLSALIALNLILQTSMSVFSSSVDAPRILGFATNVTIQEIISLTNLQRGDAGVGSVAENATLNQAAQLKAKDMFDNDYWAHTNPYDSSKDPWYWFEQASYNYYMAGENLAMNFDTSGGVVNGWMASPSHRENLLNDSFTEIGVAVVNGVLQGQETTLVVQLFGVPLGAAQTIEEGVDVETTPDPAPTSTSTPAQQLPTSTPVPLQVVQQTVPTAVPTLATPTVTPTPTPDAETITAVVRTPEGARPLQTTSTVFGGEQKWQTLRSSLANPMSLGIGRLSMLGLLIFLILLFMVDSIVILRKGHFHVDRSHGFLHVGVFVILIAALLYNSVGIVI